MRAIIVGEAVSAGNPFSFCSIATMQIADGPARTGRNSAPGDPIKIEAKRMLKLKQLRARKGLM